MTQAFPCRSTRRQVLAGLGAATIAPGFGIGRTAPAPTPIAGEVMPPAPRDATVDVLHGVSVPDPFRPFEDPSRLDCRAWVDAMDSAAKAALNGNPTHAQVRAFLRATGKYSRPYTPHQLGSRYFSMAF